MIEHDPTPTQVDLDPSRLARLGLSRLDSTKPKPNRLNLDLTWSWSRFLIKLWPT